MEPNDYETRAAYCYHTLLRVTSIHTQAGYSIQCLNCRMVGPERESLREALRALRRTPYCRDQGGNA